MGLILLFNAFLLSSLTKGYKVEGAVFDLHRTLALVIIISILILFFILAVYSNMLRDRVNDYNAFNEEAKKRELRRKLSFVKNDNPYSLSRVQFAVWTVIISCSYIYLQLSNSDCVSTEINKTALILMGIGAGVTAVGNIIDKKEVQDGCPRHQNKPSEGLFIDILSDENGISIHRFQIFVWTIIAMIIYLNQVSGIKSGCALPELSDTLLALTGISSATYVVMKSQENTLPPTANGASDQTGTVVSAPPTPVTPPTPAPQNS